MIEDDSLGNRRPVLKPPSDRQHRHDQTIGAHREARTRGMIQAEILLLLGAAAVFGLLALPLLLRVPAVHTDEAGFAQASLSLARNGSMASPGYALVEPSFATHTYWMPPAYFVAVASVFKVVGFGIVQLRLFSVLMGLCALASLYLSLRHIQTNSLLRGAALALLVTDATFLEESRLGRMEAMTMAGVAAGAYCYLRSLDARPARLRWAVAAGTFAAVAWLTHPLGLALLSAIVVSETIRIPRQRCRAAVTRIGALIAPSVVGGIGWLAYIAQDPSGFRQQMSLQSANKRPAYVFERAGDVLQQYHPQLAPEYVVYFSLACLAAILMLRRPDSSRRFLSLLFVIGSVGAVYGSDPWYLGYLPFYGIGSFVLVAEGFSPSPRWIWCAAIPIAVSLMVVNIASDAHLYWKYNVKLNEQANYIELARQTDALIPEGQRVFLSTSNSPYFVMAQHRDLSDLVMSARGKEETLEPALSLSHYVVLDSRGGVSQSALYEPSVRQFVKAHGEFVGRVGYTCSECFSFEVWKVTANDSVGARTGR